MPSEMGVVRVFVVAPTVMPGPQPRGLVAQLGAGRVARLSELMLERAVAAADDWVPGAIVEVVSAADVRARATDAAAGLAGVPPAADGSADAPARRGAGGRLLIVWPPLGRWRREHLAGALEDLDDGCGVSVAPLFDGGLYILALSRMIPALLELDDDVLTGPRAMGELLDAAGAAGADVGLLRAERALRRPADIAAALADPLLDDELRGLLAG